MFAVVASGVSRFISPFNLKVCLILLLIAVVAHPFGVDHAAAISTQLLFWALVVLVSSFIGHIGHAFGDAIWRRDQVVLIDITMIGIMSVFFTPILMQLINTLIAGPDEQISFLTTLGYVVVITVAIALFRRILPGVVDEPHADAAALQTQKPRLYKRLPEGVEGPILHLTVRDHFVDVVTTDGTHTIRMRFADAVDEMEPVDGFCTHRSHWVNRDAVMGSVRENGRSFLELSNGTMVPVSRSYQNRLQDEGLLDLERATA